MQGPLSPVIHKLPNGIKTHFIHELEAGRIGMPRNAEEFRELIELVMYDPAPYTFHPRFMEALLDSVKPTYGYLKQSECGFFSHACQ